MSIETFIDSLNWRYATKSFDPSKKISEEMLDKLLQTMALAPSSFGLQPWKFFVVTNPEAKSKLREFAWNQPQITECSHLIVLASKTSIDADYINAYAERIVKERGIQSEDIAGYRSMMLGALPMMQGQAGDAWMTKQVYIALGILMAACAEARIDCCPMEGFEPAKFDEILGLPAKGFHAKVLCPIGYRSASDQNANAKKIRFSKSEVSEIL